VQYAVQFSINFHKWLFHFASRLESIFIFITLTLHGKALEIANKVNKKESDDAVVDVFNKVEYINPVKKSMFVVLQIAKLYFLKSSYLYLF